MDTNDAIVRGLGLTQPQAAMLVAALRDPRGRPTMAPPSPRMALIRRGCFDEGYPHTITATGRGLAEEMLATGWRDIDPVLEVLPPTVIANLPAAPAPQPFDYSGWQPQLADAARAAAATIRRHGQAGIKKVGARNGQAHVGHDTGNYRSDGSTVRRTANAGATAY